MKWCGVLMTDMQVLAMAIYGSMTMTAFGVAVFRYESTPWWFVLMIFLNIVFGAIIRVKDKPKELGIK